MASKAPDQPQAPEDLLQVRKRLKLAERKGVDVAEAKRLLVRAVLAFRERRLDDMGEAIRGASQAADEGERSLREERLRREVWALREGGTAPEGLSRVESALAQRDIEEAEAALATLSQGPPRAARRWVAPASVAGLAFESRSFRIVLARPGSGGALELVDIRRGEAGPEGLEAAVGDALRGLRPRPRRVHVALPQDAHVLSPVSLPLPLPSSEQAQAVRWKLAKLCDFPPDDALVVSRPLPSGGKESSVLGLLARPEAVARILGMVRGAGLPVGKILPPSETVHTLLPPTTQREARVLVDIGRDTSRIYVFGPAGLTLSRDLGVGTALWLSALETPISSTRGSVKLSARQAQEVLGRFDVSGAENLILEDGTALNDKDLHALLRPSLERLQDALLRSLEFSGSGGLIAQVFLCGEGASLPGLDRVLASRLGGSVSVSVLGLSGCAAPQANGLALAPADALAASLVLAAGDAKVLDLAPASARVEAALDRGLLPACVLGLFLTLGLLGLALFARHYGPGAESSLQDTKERIRIVKQKIDEGNAELASRHAAAPVVPPGGSGAAAAVLRELSLVLPPEGALLGLSMELTPQGGALLLLSAPSEPDLAPVLSRDPLLGGRVGAEILPLGGVRYRCDVPKERLP